MVANAHQIDFRDVEPAEWTHCETATQAAQTAFPVLPADELSSYFELNDVNSVALGVRLSPDTEVEALADRLDQIALIEVDFPAYTDGRGYSQARVLREHMGFQGELRAVGDVLIDQLRFMKRCGFDVAVLADHVDPDDAEAALKRYGVWYQPAADDRPPAHRLRRFVQNWEI
ncbi:MAG: DUF934 domain-containing protein [Sphingomonadales bacterium]